MVVLPAIVTHATAAQSPELARPILEGRAAWCLLLSEPDAGTDLAALTTAAVRDGDEWVIDGRKTWATGAHLADRALLLARTGADDARHRGLTAFGARPPPARRGDPPDAGDDRPGAVQRRVPHRGARAGFGGARRGGRRLGGRADCGDGGAAQRRRAPCRDGSAGHGAGDLDRRAGDFVGTAPRRRNDDRPFEAPAALAVRLASGDPALRQDAGRVSTSPPRSPASPRRAAATSPVRRTSPSCGPGRSPAPRPTSTARALGGAATLHAYRRPAGDDAAAVTSLVLAAPSMSLVGGNDFVQRDQLAERILGLPKSP